MTAIIPATVKWDAAGMRLVARIGRAECVLAVAHPNGDLCVQAADSRVPCTSQEQARGVAVAMLRAMGIDVPEWAGGAT